MSLRNLCVLPLALVLAFAPGCISTGNVATDKSGALIACVVCAKRMPAAAVTRPWNGKTLCFCGPECEKRFVKHPEQFPH